MANKRVAEAMRSKVFYLRDKDFLQVREIAEKENISLSEVCRRAIAHYYENWEYDNKQEL